MSLGATAKPAAAPVSCRPAAASHLDDDALRQCHDDAQEHDECHACRDESEGFSLQRTVGLRRKKELGGQLFHGGLLLVNGIEGVLAPVNVRNTTSGMTRRTKKVI